MVRRGTLIINTNPLPNTALLTLYALNRKSRFGNYVDGTSKSRLMRRLWTLMFLIRILKEMTLLMGSATVVRADALMIPGLAARAALANRLKIR